MTLIPNKIKFATSATTGTIKVGNFILGVNDNITYAPTSVTGFYQGLTPVTNGYVVYQNKVSGGPSTFRPNSDSEFIGLAKALGGTNVTGVTDGLVYLNSQSSIIAVNRDYEDIVTSGLTLNLDAGFTPSYRRSGTTWTDLSFSGNNGVLTNGPTFSFSGSGSIVFDGVDDYVNIPTSITMGSQNTVIGFIKLSGTNSDTVVFCPEANGVDNWLGIQSNRILLYATEISDVNNFAIQGITNLDTSDSIWYQIVSTINNNVATIYLNGVQENTVTKNFTIGSWTSNVNLGRRGGFSQTRYFKGSISSVQVYNRVLSPTEIVQNYQAHFPRFLGENIVSNGLVFYVDAGYRPSYPTTGTTWYDVSGYGRNGTLTNGPTYSTDGGGSIVFDGTDDYVTNIGDVSTFSFIQNTGVFTISAWVKLTDLSIARYFIGNNNGSTTNKGFYLGYQGNTGRLWLAITYGVGGQTTLNQSRTNFFTDNNWVLVTCVGNGVNCQFYKNGVSFGASGNFGTFSTGNSFAVLDVGRYNAGTADEWKGNIALTQIYNRELSSVEVLQNYNAQKSRYGL
jgi:hypothetical protein